MKRATRRGKGHEIANVNQSCHEVNINEYVRTYIFNAVELSTCVQGASLESFWFCLLLFTLIGVW